MAEASPTRNLLRVLILGGGFGGVYAAKRLRSRLARLQRPVQLTLVNRDNFLLFTPMLHEVAASDLDLTHIVIPLRKLIPNATLFIGEVEAIDLKSRIVTVSHAGGAHWHDLDYDHLVLALGSVTNFLGLPGVPFS
jgi:NADH dehydrogenase